MKKITLLLTLFTCIYGNAQWTDDTTINTPVATSNTEDVSAIGTSDGKTYVVFWKVVPEPVNYELRVQLLDTSGNKQFGSDGLLVSNTIPMSTNTYVSKITTDTANNLYIGVTASEDNSAHIFKINTSGDSLWGSDGISPGTGFLPTVLPLATGDVIICYWPGSQKAIIQKYTSDGTSVWDNPVSVVSTNASSATIPADLFEMSNHDFMLVFHTKIGFGISSNLYAQKYDLEGVPQWSSALQLSDNGTVYNTAYSCVQQGDVVYYGYSSSQISRFDSYLQRINADGTLPWGINGIDFDTNQDNYEMDTKIASEAASPYIWAICRYMPSGQDSAGEYVQKFAKDTGERQLTDSAKEIFPIDSNKTHAGNLYVVNDRPVFTFTTGFDNGSSPITLNAAILTTDGDIALDTHIPVATLAASKSNIAFTGIHNGQGVVVFRESKTEGESKAYAQNFTSPLLLGVSTYTPSNTITLYPNPSNNVITVGSRDLIKSLKVYDAQGRMIESHSGTNESTDTVNVSAWNAGTYFLKIETPTGTVNRKFIKG